MVPGLHATCGLEFEYGDERFIPKALTTGVSVDAFLVAPEVFAANFEQNNRLFVTYLRPLKSEEIGPSKP